MCIRDRPSSAQSDVRDTSARMSPRRSERDSTFGSLIVDGQTMEEKWGIMYAWTHAPSIAA